jgi:hypothetical protein
MNATKNAVLITLFATTLNGTKHYSKAGENTIRSLLEKYHGIIIKRRWLFNCLADIEARGLIHRKRRYRHEAHGKIRQYSSMISFTIEGIKYLVAKKVKGAFELLKRMLAWIKGIDQRWPTPKNITIAPTSEQREANLLKLKDLLARLG